MEGLEMMMMSSSSLFIASHGWLFVYSFNYSFDSRYLSHFPSCSHRICFLSLFFSTCMIYSSPSRSLSVDLRVHSLISLKYSLLFPLSSSSIHSSAFSNDFPLHLWLSFHSTKRFFLPFLEFCERVSTHLCALLISQHILLTFSKILSSSFRWERLSTAD